MPVKRRSFVASTVAPAASVEDKSLVPRLLPIPQVATYLGTSTWTVRDLIRRNELKKIRLGKKFLIDRTDLNAFIERQKAAA